MEAYEKALQEKGQGMEHDELHHALKPALVVAGVPVCIDQDEALLVHSLRALAGNAGIHLICDENTLDHCLPLYALLRACCKEPIVIPPGEPHKLLHTCETVWEALIDQGADRKSVIVNLGGGVVTDLGGFCASVFQRGVRFVHLPTTLLGMCDAAIGGKQGVDFGGLKNYLGVFAQPALVWIDSRFLSTLSTRQVRNGMAEVLKHAIIADPELFARLENLGPDGEAFRRSIAEIIRHAIAIKKQFVEQDVREAGIRAALNFGHTFGHALESLLLKSNAPPLHGECVAAGIIFETWLSHFVLGSPDRDMCRRITDCIRSWVPFGIRQDIAREDLINLMKRDKKSESGEIHFTLIREIGEVETGYPVAEAELQRLIGYPEATGFLPGLQGGKT